MSNKYAAFIRPTPIYLIISRVQKKQLEFKWSFHFFGGINASIIAGVNERLLPQFGFNSQQLSEVLMLDLNRFF